MFLFTACFPAALQAFVDKTSSLMSKHISKDVRWCAYTVSTAGSDMRDIHIMGRGLARRAGGMRGLGASKPQSLCCLVRGYTAKIALSEPYLFFVLCAKNSFPVYREMATRATEF